MVSVTVLKPFQVSEAWPVKCEMWQSGKKESLDKVSPHIVVCLENFRKAITYLLISLSRLKGLQFMPIRFDSNWKANYGNDSNREAETKY